MKHVASLEKRNDRSGPALQKMLSAFPHAHEKHNGWYEHPDNPRFDFRVLENGAIRLHSWTGRTEDEILAMGGLSRSDIQLHGRTYPGPTKDSLDLLDLAIAKKIHPHFLESLGLQSGYNYHGRNYVKIPYYHSDESEHTKIKVRKAVDGKYKHCWDEGTPGEIIPYGLHKLGMAHEVDYLIIGEGESDAWTCWYHDIPFLGIPGANHHKCFEYINIALLPNRIYILQEPDQKLKLAETGQGFYKMVHNALRSNGYQGEIFCIQFMEVAGHKDPSDLHIALWKEGKADQFKEIIGQAMEQAIPANDGGPSNGRPQIILGGQLRNIRDESLEALALAEKDHPTIFVQSARLVQIGHDESKKAIIMHMGVSEMRNALTKSADFYRIKKEDGSLSHALPPKDIADAIIALDPSQWPFQPLEAIVETPVIRPDGTILDTPGYDEQTRLYYAPHKNMQDCRVPLNPTKEEMQKALAVLEDVIGDFPFADSPDRANTLGLMMTPVIRPAIKRHVPLALIDAPKQGTGKGLLSDVISIIATGETASILTAPNSDDEWDKRITALLMSGATSITIDNIPSKLQSATLDAVLTASWWTSRILGFSKMIKVPQRATWIATGNNIRLGGDLARRCYRIRLDPKVSRPWMRTGFKHEDLATYVTDNRAEIITAILTLVRGWYAAGCPTDPAVPSLGTFSGWAKMVGSILSFVGISGFLTNLDKLYDEMDEENTQWANFLQSWMEVFGNESITVATLHNEITKEPDVFAGSAENVAGSRFSDFLPDYLQTALKEKPKSFKQILGKQLEKRLETCFGDDNLRLERQRDVHNKIAKWRVVAGSAGSNPTPKHAGRGSEKTDSLIYSNGLNHSPHSPQEILTQDMVSSVDQPVEPVQQISKEFSENRLPASSESLPARLPNRPCLRCGAQDWRWDAVFEIAVCGGCSK